MNRTELDALYGRMTAGEWGLCSKCEVVATDPSGEYDIAVVCLTYDGTANKHDDAAGIVALKNAWPAVSAELAAKDARIAELEGKNARLLAQLGAIASPSALPSHGDPNVLRKFARAALKGTTDERD